jgi:hypothetical protein
MLRVYVPVEHDAHVAEILVAEHDEIVTVYATVCVSAWAGLGPRRHEPHRVPLEQPLGGRAVYDGVTGERLPLDVPVP